MIWSDTVWITAPDGSPVRVWTAPGVCIEAQCLWHCMCHLVTLCSVSECIVRRSHVASVGENQKHGAELLASVMMAEWEESNK